MKKLQLIYFEGCPNAKDAKDVLSASGLDFEIVKQEELSSENPLLCYSSPIILQKGEIIFGSKIDLGSSACSVQKINKEELLKKLKTNRF